MRGAATAENSLKNHDQDGGLNGGLNGGPNGGPNAATWRMAASRTAAALLWPPQAALIAWTVQGIADGAAMTDAAANAAALLALGLLRGGLDAGGERAAFVAARRRLSQLRARALADVAALSPLDARRPASGFIASAVAEQAEAAVPYLARFVPARVKAAVVPLAVVAVVAWFSWAAALILLLATPVIPLFMALIGWRAKAASEEQLQATGDVNGFLLDRLRGLTSIRALGAVDLTADRLRDEADNLRVRTMAVLRIAFLSSAALELFAALGVALTAGYVGLHLLGQLDFGAWGGRLTLAEGLFVLMLAPAAFEPLRELAAVWHDRAAGQAAMAALGRLTRGAARLPEAEHAETSIFSSISPPSVTIRGVTFAHAGAAVPALRDVNLTVDAGAHVALFSPSGGGKTTLLSLIAGLATPQCGAIELGGVALTPQTAANLRRRVAWIGQKPHFFAGSLRANIALGRADAMNDPDRIAALLAEYGLPADPARRVGENGVGLSGGEALRLALARAAADKTRDIILADEPTAHLDAAAAVRVADALLRLAADGGRTLVVATHDPALAARMNRIVAVNDIDGVNDADAVNDADGASRRKAAV